MLHSVRGLNFNHVISCITKSKIYIDHKTPNNA
jgi:hypothetical protein